MSPPKLPSLVVLDLAGTTVRDDGLARMKSALSMGLFFLDQTDAITPPPPR